MNTYHKHRDIILSCVQQFFKLALLFVIYTITEYKAIFYKSSEILEPSFQMRKYSRVI